MKDQGSEQKKDTRAETKTARADIWRPAWIWFTENRATGSWATTLTWPVEQVVDHPLPSSSKRLGDLPENGRAAAGAGAGEHKN